MRRSQRPELSVETVHVDPEEWSEIYLVGDVHGCPGALEELLESELAVDDDDLVVFVGDLVRKGPDSAAVVDRVREADNLLTVRGNNEQKLLDGDDSLPELSESDLAWMADLPLAVTLPGTLVVHGGVDADVPLADHTPRELMTMRATPHGSGDRPYWFETRTTRPTVVFGHTVLEEPHHTGGAVGLDTGCVHGRALTYYDWRADEVGQLPVDTVYEERPPSKLLDAETPTAARADD
ncbi:metallophosphoesterase [Halobaculum sp. MBLA0143]|uniref:metallophosphoesterase n=1 Tax=Halobaculum sp. MBLA0143 TaxID=3079933 RepID=UPI003525EE60